MRGVSLAGAEVIHVTQKALLQASKSIVVCNDFFYFLIFLFDKQFLSRSWLEITAVLSQQTLDEEHSLFVVVLFLFVLFYHRSISKSKF